MDSSLKIEIMDNPNPLILTFPQNIPPNLESKIKAIEFMVQDKEIKDITKIRKAIKISSDKVTWVGKTDYDQGDMQFLVGVIDQQQFPGQLQTYPCQGHFKMTQYIHKQLGTNLLLKEANNEKKKLTHFQQQLLVAEELGTSKSKRKMRAMETNRVQEENISQANQFQEQFHQQKQAFLDQINKDNEEERSLYQQSKKDLLPLFNLNEKKDPAKIFDISSLITDEDLECLDVAKLYVAILKKQDLILDAIANLETYTQSLILDNIEFLQQTPNPVLQVKLKYLVFLDIMIKFVQQHRFFEKNESGIAQKMRIYNNQNLKTILSHFYQATAGSGEFQNYTKANIMQDKLICHLIILHLTIFNQTFEASNLAKLLKLNPSRFMTYCRECGCQSTQKSEQIVVKLSAPLTFPSIQKPKYNK